MRKKNLVLALKLLFLLAIAVLIAFSPRTVETISLVLSSAFEMRTRLEGVSISLNQQSSGEEVLPPPVQDLLVLLRKHRIDQFEIAGRLLDNLYYKQRSTEAAWPSRIQQRSVHKFVHIEDLASLPTHCDSYEEFGEVRYGYCP